MKIGIISDVHSNLPAFQKVLQELRNVDKIIHAGDIIGYNAHPNEVTQIFKAKDILSINGNHDRATISGDISWFNEIAAEAIQWTRKVLSPENLAFLRRLKTREFLQLNGIKIAIIHGSPYNDDEYIYENDLNSNFLKDVDAKILILGHTHVPYIKKFDNGMILNPGSVGQPRDENWKASYAILELEGQRAKIYRTEYDLEATIKAICKNNLPVSLANRLLYGL